MRSGEISVFKRSLCLLSVANRDELIRLERCTARRPVVDMEKAGSGRYQEDATEGQKKEGVKGGAAALHRGISCMGTDAGEADDDEKGG